MNDDGRLVVNAVDNDDDDDWNIDEGELKFEECSFTRRQTEWEGMSLVSSPCYQLIAPAFLAFAFMFLLLKRQSQVGGRRFNRTFEVTSRARLYTK